MYISILNHSKLGRKKTTRLFAIIATCLLLQAPACNSTNKNDYKLSDGMANVLSGLMAYRDRQGTLPPLSVNQQGVPQLSWRALILQLVDPIGHRNQLEVRLSEPWTSEMNASVGESKYGRDLHAIDDSFASVFAINGDHTPFPPCVEVEDGRSLILPHSNPPEVLPPDLILIVSVKQSDVHWLQPGDLSLSVLTNAPTGATCDDIKYFVGGVCVGFADGQVWELSGQTPVSVLVPFLTDKSPARFADRREKELLRYRKEQGSGKGRSPNNENLDTIKGDKRK